MYCDQMKFKYDEMGSFLLSIDSSSAENGRLLWWSRAFEMIMDYSVEELKKMHISSFMTGSMALTHKSALDNYVNTGLSHKLYKPFMAPFVNKTKYCEMVNLQIKPFVVFNPFKVTLISYGEINSNFGSDYIVVNKYGFVETFTTGFAKILGKHIHMGFQEKLPLIYFCPSLTSFLLSNSPLFKNQFVKLEDDSIISFKKTVDRHGTETFIENFIWNSFDENQLIQMQNVLTEAIFLDKSHVLEDFIHEQMSKLTATKTTSLITMRITKQSASTPDNIYFFIEFINIKHYEDLLKSTSKLTQNLPLKWLMKIGPIEGQFDERFQKSMIMEDIKKTMQKQKLVREIGSISDNLEERYEAGLPLEPDTQNVKKNKLVQKASQITKMLKFMKPLQPEDIWNNNDFNATDFEDSNESATLLMDSQIIDGEEQDIAEKKLHFRSTFLQPKRQTIAQRDYLILKIFLLVRFLFYASFLISIFVFSITVHSLDHKKSSHS
jgi:hypothetical protein